MLDVSVSYNRYKFVGFEFLTWLWFLIENHQDDLRGMEEGLDSLDVGNRIVIENQLHDAKESVTIKGDDIGLEEGILALRKGAVVTEMNLVYQSGEQEWRFTIKGESFNLGNLKTPETGPMETGDDVEGALLEKIYLYEKMVHFLDNIYGRFLRLRLSGDWNGKIVPRIKNWIHS